VEGRGVISTQVMQEFFVVATRKVGVDSATAKMILVSLRNYEVVTVTPEMVIEAAECSILEKLSLWDALLVAAAASASCGILASEDL
jgi:predicted nucleic acid-binding protein